MRRLLTVLAVLVVLAAGGDVLFWRWAEAQLETGFAAWRDRAREAGWAVDSAPPVRGGWPLDAALTLPDVRVRDTGGNVPGGLRWSADRVTLRVSLLQPRTLLVLPSGTERLQVADAPEIAFGFDRLTGTVPLSPAPLPGFAVDILAKGGHAALSASPDAVPGATSGATLTVADLTGHVAWQQATRPGQPALSLGLRAEAIDLPPGRAWPLGPRLSSLSFDGALAGPLDAKPGSNLAAPGGLAARAAAWREAGGTLEVSQLSIGWGPLGLTGSASLALDPQLQPDGAGTARVIGYAETLDALAQSGTIPSRAALAAKAVLSLMARTPEGGVPQVELPFTLQDRGLAVGGIPVARVPDLAWPS